MRESLTLFCWFSGLLVILIFVINALLIFKFKRYFSANGFGVVTLSLLSLVVSHSIVAFLFGMVVLITLFTGDIHETVIYRVKEFATTWLVTSSLLHIMGVTFQRIVSFSNGGYLLKATRSKASIALFLSAKWLFTVIVTVITFNSKSTKSATVYHVGLFLVGILTIFNFLVTVNVSSEFDSTVSSPNMDRPRVMTNPRKTFVLFAGLVFSFAIFSLPLSLPNLVYAVKGKHVTKDTLSILSLWALLGAVFNCLWILMRLRSTVNDNSGFYSRWTFNKRTENVHLKRHIENKLTTRKNSNRETDFETL